jgi:SAM-dependent methyltransferase
VSPTAPRFELLDACPVCGSAASHERFSSPDLLMGVPGVFRYVECDACRTVFQNPRVRGEDLALCYPADYFTHGGSPWTPTPAAANGLRDRLRRSIRAAADGVPERLSPGLRVVGWLLARHPGLRRRARLGLVDGLELPDGGRGRCLEVGPGQGIDLFCLRTLGWDAHGLEVDPLAAEQARATSGCEVRVGTLAATDYPPGSFDLVYMSHVFEHLPDPAPSLRRCLDLLSPGGRLVLVYPNPTALSATRYGPTSVVWDPPRHLVLPPLGAILSLLERSGFVGAAGATLARHAPVNAGAARQRLRGERWDPLRLEPPGLGGRAFGLAEALLVALGRPLGEETVVRARRPRAAPSAAVRQG